jgi:hypothetical protein
MQWAFANPFITFLIRRGISLKILEGTCILYPTKYLSSNNAVLVSSNKI